MVPSALPSVQTGDIVNNLGSPLPALAYAEINTLPLDHPGAHDPAYRQRRAAIAALARQYQQNPQQAIPQIAYTAEETAVWRHVNRQLQRGHQRHACSFYLAAKQRLGISADDIPQLGELSARLQQLNNFRLAPVEGLVESRAFFSRFNQRTMLSTQYVRHHSRPDYTPEPDVVHELLGHVPAFSNPDFAAFSQVIGQGALRATTEQLTQLSRLYWFTVEFGLLAEGSEIKAFGAGLLSSYGELAHAFSPAVERRPFNLAEVIEAEYDYTIMQPVLFIIPSFAYLKEITGALIQTFGKSRDLEVAPTPLPNTLW